MSATDTQCHNCGKECHLFWSRMHHEGICYLPDYVRDRYL